MLVRHLCYYLTEWGGVTPRQEDYDTNKVVKCLKNEAIKGYSNITIGGVTFRLATSGAHQQPPEVGLSKPSAPGA
jgi:hypothetical protein